MQRPRTARSWLSTAVTLTIAVSTALATAAGFGQQQPPQPPQQPQTNAPAINGSSQLTIGTFSPRKAFSSYHKRTEFREKATQYQGALQKAQKSQDTKKMMEIQKQMQQARKKVVDDFQSDLKNAMPKVARKAQVQLIVTGVQYKSPAVKTKDVTQQVVQELNAGTKQSQKKNQLGGPRRRLPRPGQGQPSGNR